MGYLCQNVSHRLLQDTHTQGMHQALKCLPLQW
jgi:hypothetical protein